VKKRLRLTARSDFQRLLGARRLYAGANLVGFASAGPGPGSRIGVSTSRQIRGSVSRNRARRRLREAVRLRLLADGSLLGRPGITLDVVLIARPGAVDVPLATLCDELGEFEARLLRVQP